MSVTGLYSGIGGFELAFASAGFETDLLAEVDPDAQAVLRAHFPQAEVRSNVLDIVDLPSRTYVLTAGFPCQNLSMAGDKSGIGGEKSKIVTKMFALIERRRVPIVVIENVYFMLQLDSGRAMTWLVEEFEALGYRWAYRVLDTMGFGLPQRRRRVYFVATQDLDPRTVLFADDMPPCVAPKHSLDGPLGFYWTEGRSGVGFTVDGIPPLKIGSALGIPSAPAVLFEDGEVLMPDLEACERLQGFPAGWTNIGTDPDGRRRPEWRMVGNAASVPVAQWVARRIKSPGPVLEFRTKSIDEGEKWPSAAWNVGAGPVGVVASETPIQISRRPISEFRSAAWTRLSDRALDGFISRAVAGGLKMPTGFLDALRVAHRKVKARRSTKKQSDEIPQL